MNRSFYPVNGFSGTRWFVYKDGSGPITFVHDADEFMHSAEGDLKDWGQGGFDPPVFVPHLRTGFVYVYSPGTPP